MLEVIDHPVIQTELSGLRDRDCPSREFRARVRRVASLMVPAVTAGLETRPIACETPLEVTSGVELARPVVLAPILRAGIGFLDGFLDLLPDASIAHIGLARNEETLQPEPYYFKTPPDLGDAEVIVLDPMLATGGSVSEAIRQLRDSGATRLRFACLVAAPEGVKAIESEHPDLPIFTAALDRCLNAKGYILPGLGDAGDRIFGT
ncbi:uracil phosphoribosyltransferase [Haloferula helveola]|uniref:Uracil phosphoribosyltransferase n=2 Tax=Haloferula helveola TaxID=490095 RepID=A0ABM7RGW5_9BACT|nr:uracil phosphoribosyltransferase [Haloferula helveola]